VIGRNFFFFHTYSVFCFRTTGVFNTN
jgi:hypothetical protein